MICRRVSLSLCKISNQPSGGSNRSPAGKNKVPKTTAEILEKATVVPDKTYTAQDLIDMSYEMYAIAHKAEELDYDNAAAVKSMLLVIDKLEMKINADPDPENHKAIKTEMLNGLKIIRGQFFVRKSTAFKIS